MTAATQSPLPGETPVPSRFLGEARAIPAEEVVPLRTDPAVAERNVAAGVAAVLAYEAHVREHLPAVDLEEIRSLPALARAVVEAAERAGVDDAELRSSFTEAGTLSRTLRAATVALVEAGVLSPRDLAKLSLERGAVDVGADCVTLASLLQRREEEISGKCPVDEEAVARAGEVGAALRALWKPKGPARKPGPDGLSPIDARDRLWTLLLVRHERLWAVGAYVYGYGVDARIPPLHAPPPTSRKAR